MKSQLAAIVTLTILSVSLVSCFKGKSKGVLDNGQVMGVAPSARLGMGKPIGMVYVPPGMFHMGPSDEDVNYNFTARNKSVSIAGFWMDRTEITNNQYRQFVYWVRDSLAAIQMGYMKTSADGDTAIDWKKAQTINYNNRTTLEKLNTIVLAPDNRLYNKMDIDPAKLMYNV
jgi:sulfatase modifying factor 1